MRDVAEIVTYLQREVSATAASKTEDQLFAAFGQIAHLPGLGHQRTDLTDKKVLFQTSPPYLIVFRRSRTCVSIVHVVHGSRDLKRLFSS